ncbi:hypothetical protein Fuma_02476 [Fuerstiella marisgermanici]|uniref:Uncharacterized protein n=1 Tax=Fuerstiella marisgermanici TaxID=1891926 RepID=A0A1P8WFM8_9PLAN|nr:hypothetical protein Fuma_02476 [Fuerstiella marisgermanici]
MNCPEEVAKSYVRFNEQHLARFNSGCGGFDRLLMKMGRHRWLLRIADCYAALFRRHSILRQRLVLCLALLECRPEFDQALQCRRPIGRLRASVELVSALAVQAGVAAAAVTLLGPIDVASRLFYFGTGAQSKEEAAVR